MNFIDLFCGIGGFSLGFKLAGFDYLVGVDREYFTKNKINFPNTTFLVKDISNVTYQTFEKLIPWKLGNLDVVIGGSPCQGFSILGQQNVDDNKNQLIYEYGRLVNQVQPRFFVFENVPAFLDNKFKSIVDPFSQLLTDIGYRYVVYNLNTASFGVPQNRNRIFIIGTKLDINLKKINFDQYTLSKQTARIAFQTDCYQIRNDIINYDIDKDFDWDSTTLTGTRTKKHRIRQAKLFAELPPGQRDPKSKNDKIHPDYPSFTVKATNTLIHPFEGRNITAREAARLQGFPDWFEIDDRQLAKGFASVGNCVSPVVSYIIALEIKNLLQDYDSSNQ